jgi:flagellar motility protein MotE (MotC chaperone)
MKKSLSNIPAYLGAFIVVTVVIIYLNGMYRNIFTFDFTPIGTKTIIKVPKVKRISKDSIQAYLLKKIQPEITQTIKKIKPKVVVDTVKHVALQDSALLDSLKKIRAQVKTLQKYILALSRKSNKSPTSAKKESKIDDNEIKLTAKLLQSMSPTKAAQVLMTYSDNNAKKILAKMNSKKAALVLNALKPQQVAKIMRF